MTDDIKAIRDALADPGLTHGEWVACGPSFGEPLPRYLSEVIRPDDADGGDAVARAMGGMEADSSADMAYIAACHPERIARLLDALEAATRDAARYRWLRDAHPETENVIAVDWRYTAKNMRHEELDAAIDAAMSAEPQSPPADRAAGESVSNPQR